MYFSFPQRSGGPKTDFSEAFRPTGNGGAGAEPPLTIILIKSRLTVPGLSAGLELN